MGQKECPPASLSSDVLYLLKAVNQIRRLKTDGVSPGPSPKICIFEIGLHEVCHPPAIRQLI